MAACFAAVVLLNMRNDKYDKLPDADRQALLELETYMKAELLEKEYVLLDEIWTQMRKRIRDKEALYDLAEEYVAAAKALEAEDPELAAHYAERETVEGSAEYVGIQASRIVGYDYGVMYFTNQTDVPFSTVVPNVEAGLVSRDFVADSIPYRTGATLCQLMDAMELTDWQERLNSREEATLLSVLESYLV